VFAGIVVLGAGTGIAALIDHTDHPRMRVTTEQDLDRAGGLDYAQLEAPRLDVCSDACISDRRCKSFSYDVDAGRCYLKGNVPKGVASTGVISGVKRRR
jgi:hypothetical protein